MQSVLKRYALAACAPILLFLTGEAISRQSRSGSDGRRGNHDRAKAFRGGGRSQRGGKHPFCSRSTGEFDAGATSRRDGDPVVASHEHGERKKMSRRWLGLALVAATQTAHCGLI